VVCLNFWSWGSLQKAYLTLQWWVISFQKFEKDKADIWASPILSSVRKLMTHWIKELIWQKDEWEWTQSNECLVSHPSQANLWQWRAGPSPQLGRRKCWQTASAHVFNCHLNQALILQQLFRYRSFINKCRTLVQSLLWAFEVWISHMYGDFNLVAIWIFYSVSTSFGKPGFKGSWVWTYQRMMCKYWNQEFSSQKQKQKPGV